MALNTPHSGRLIVKTAAFIGARRQRKGQC